MSDRQLLIDRMLRFADHFGIGSKLLLGGPALGVSVQIAPRLGGILTQLQMACGVLTYGREHPTLAICHHELYWRIYYAVIRGKRYPHPEDDGAPPEWMMFNNAPLTWHKDCKWRSVALLNEERMEAPGIEPEEPMFGGEHKGRYYLNGFLEIQL